MLLPRFAMKSSAASRAWLSGSLRVIQPERIVELNQKPVRDGAKFVLYWMQQAQRAEWNHALEFAIMQANALALPLTVCFALTDDYPEANERHYAFMLEGLSETAIRLRERGARFLIERGSPAQVVLPIAPRAALVVTDRGGTRIQSSWRADLAGQLDCRMVQVETDVVVPVETAYPKEAYTAAVLRPKITRLLGQFLTPLKPTALQCVVDETTSPFEVEKLLGQLKVNRTVTRSRHYSGGRSAGKKFLVDFIATTLCQYAERRSDPSKDLGSHLSPYLHFGQISPLEIALAVKETGDDVNGASFLEELIVRRELSWNFTHYNSHYDAFESLPNWALTTLHKHAGDPREFLYTQADFEEASTHDPYWNAAQREMMVTGEMHNYMRMYWGKKILEWSASPEEAFSTALALNNKWCLDGRDPNSFAGVAWCFGKHDRPWSEREIFGSVRYMNAAGLRRKFDMNGYLRRIAELSR